MIKVVLRGDALTVYFIITRSVWIVYFKIVITVLTSSAGECGQQIEETAVILHEMLLSEPQIGIELGSQCVKFLKQLANTEMKLTAYGFFRIDRRLMGSMAGAATTYLVILFQIK
jgi:hypothetical protein